MSKVDVRNRLIDRLERELIGPKEGADEEFLELPNRRYVVGILYPMQTVVGEEAEDGMSTELDEDEEESSSFNPMSISHRYRPSSIGLSTTVDESTEKLRVEVRWAKYVQSEPRGPFRRIEKECGFEISTSSPHGMMKIDDEPDLKVEWRVHKRGPGLIPLSIFLVNHSQKDEDKARENQLCVFNPRIRVQADKGAILSKPRSWDEGEADLSSLMFLYRDRWEMGVGHGCSVQWGEVDGGRCQWIETTFLPQYLQNNVSFGTEEMPLQMAEMIGPANKNSIVGTLTGLVDAYELWIEETFSVDGKDRLATRMNETFDEHRDSCLESLDRMRRGIKAISDDMQCLEAFCFMNKAMLIQRMRQGDIERAKRTGGALDMGCDDIAGRTEHRWRPFQMGFILQSIPGIIDENGPDREIADLLWIPTGGGKTEAYLGLAAFTFGLRRLRAEGNVLKYSGTSVMMRYTLRLLTLQQFQRASALMCACEYIRDSNPVKWGQEPFLVGLYVGQTTTPNKIGKAGDYEKAKKEEKQTTDKYTAWYAIESWRRENQQPDQNSPFQLTSCPWCGMELGRASYSIGEDDILRTRCIREGCPFNSKFEIPVVTVDQNIYARLPCFLIATVDKFAQLPFNPEMGSLFGHVDEFCKKHGFSTRKDGPHKKSCQAFALDTPLQPVDMIIQDELHLINGPLGSLVGMYEATIDELCKREDGANGPKYIASTATIRRAGDQIWGLFNRRYRRFPSPGLHYGDSFFVKEECGDEKANRYIGVLPSGIGYATVMIRTISSIMSEIGKIKEEGQMDLDFLDEYWTLVSYYNSIRELGGARTKMEDDVHILVEEDRGKLNIEELTSRVSSKSLGDVLTRLNVRADRKGAIDILACSNMFSVGVDVQRLGVMVMNGQPKSTAEYIQSTGRVGRNKTGLVVVLYNWARPRDQSHYERFFDYHNRIQSHVESMTVTPFSRGVRERALHAQLVTLIRILDPSELYKNSHAANFNQSARARSDIFVKALVKRMGSIIVNEDSNRLREELDVFMDEWSQYSAENELSYKKYFSEKNALMRTIDQKIERLDGPLKLTPSSMRNVESEVVLTKIYGLRG